MSTRFVDSGYWLALYNAHDRWHERANAFTRSPAALVTTEAVLLEVGNAFAQRNTRPLAFAFLRNVTAVPQLEIVPFTPELFRKAVSLYLARPDKDWGLTDCVSFVVMKERGIQEALAADQHFIQAGFRALLLEDTSSIPS